MAAITVVPQPGPAFDHRTRNRHIFARIMSQALCATKRHWRIRPSGDVSPGRRLRAEQASERELDMTSGDKKAIGWTVGVTGAIVVIVVLAYALGLIPQA